MGVFGGTESLHSCFSFVAVCVGGHEVYAADGLSNILRQPVSMSFHQIIHQVAGLIQV